MAPRFGRGFGLSPWLIRAIDLGGHLKTDHRGSLQNRPRGTTLDKNLFYRARYGGGNPSSDLIDPRIGMFSLRDPSAESGSNPRLPAREGARGRSGPSFPLQQPRLLQLCGAYPPVLRPASSASKAATISD